MGTIAAMNDMCVAVDQARRDQPATKLALRPRLVHAWQITTRPDPANEAALTHNGRIIEQAIATIEHGGCHTMGKDKCSLGHFDFHFIQLYKNVGLCNYYV